MTHDTLQQLRDLGNSRRDRWHTPDTEPWSGADWSNAMCGEAGEAANVVKKIRRIETGTGSHDGPGLNDLRAMLADELADTIAYADLLAQHYDLDLRVAIASKFNEVSQREGFPERMDYPSDGEEAHAFGIEILVNPGSTSEYWRIETDDAGPFDVEGAARVCRGEFIEDGYSPDHVRVVALVPRDL
jgi:NTP pyrophosphatase (non-canonical NTP hydrolase)